MSTDDEGGSLLGRARRFRDGDRGKRSERDARGERLQLRVQPRQELLGLEPALRLPVLGQNARVASRQRIEARDAVDECRDVFRLEQDPHVAEPAESMEKPGPSDAISVNFMHC